MTSHLLPHLLAVFRGQSQEKSERDRERGKERAREHEQEKMLCNRTVLKPATEMEKNKAFLLK